MSKTLRDAENEVGRQYSALTEALRVYFDCDETAAAAIISGVHGILMTRGWPYYGVPSANPEKWGPRLLKAEKP
ncbi:MAG TPA: hypothetical protein VGK83_05160 [Acidimicrobiia bacterium]